MLETLIGLASGGAGGLLGGGLLGSIFRKKGGGVGSSSMVGVIAGAIASYFFGPTVGSVIGMAAESGMLDVIIQNLLAGVGGGAGGGLLWNIVKSAMGGGNR